MVNTIEEKIASHKIDPRFQSPTKSDMQGIQELMIPRFSSPPKPRKRAFKARRKLRQGEAYVVAKRTSAGLKLVEPRYAIDNLLTYKRQECLASRLLENETWIIYDYQNREFKEEVKA